MADPGHYVDTQSANAQIPCEAGTFNPNQGQQLRLLAQIQNPETTSRIQPLPHRYPVKRVVIKIRGNRQNANQLVWDTS